MRSPSWSVALWVVAAALGGVCGRAMAAPEPPGEPSTAACTRLESLGLFHRRAQGGPLDDFERVRRWLVASNPADLEAASTAAADLAVPAEIFALHLGADSPQSDFRAWLGALERTDFTALPPSPALARVAAEASSALVAAFDHCVGEPGFHLWTETTLDPAVLEVHARLVPGAGPTDSTIDRLVVEEGAESLPLECTPDLLRPRRVLLVRRRPRLDREFAATCLRADPLQPVEVRLEAGDEVHVRQLPPMAGAPTAAATTLTPLLACADPATPREPSTLRVATECAASTGERSRRSRRHPGWNSRAEARSLCPHRDLDSEATAALQLRCRPREDGSVELQAAGELTARAGWNRRGCVVDEKDSKTHCPATARIEGETTTALWVDLTSRHCLRVALHEGTGTGERANNGSRGFGPERFTPDYLTLRDPHDREVPLATGVDIPLDVPGLWQLTAGGDGRRMPGGWHHRAARNQSAGTYRFRQRLRLEIFEAGADGACSVPDATGSAP